jgi:spermidine/putrescine transport system substrate-binding protein
VRGIKNAVAFSSSPSPTLTPALSRLLERVRTGIAPIRLLIALPLAFLLFNLAQSADTLYLYNWNNYISDRTIARFEAECACKVVRDYYSDNEEMLAKLAAGASGHDLIVPTGNAVEALIRSKQLRPLDKTRLARLGNIKPEFLNAFFDPGNRYSVPYAYTVTLIGYNVEKLKALNLPTDTWAVLFEPRHLEKLKGRVTVLDSQRELMAAAMRYLGYSVNDTDEAKWKRARDLILRAKPYWAAFNASSYIKELTVGNIWLAHGYSNDMFQAKTDAEGAGRPFHIGYSIPRKARCWPSIPWCCTRPGGTRNWPCASWTSCWRGKTRRN